MRAASKAFRQPPLAQGSGICLYLAERDRHHGKRTHDARERSASDSSAASMRAEAIRELALIVGFHAEVFDPATRQWVPGFAVHSEFSRPAARALHAVALRRRGLANEKIAKVLRIKRDRVSFLAWRGDGFLMSVAGSTGYEEARQASRRRL